jgi:hypothetical protein
VVRGSAYYSLVSVNGYYVFAREPAGFLPEDEFPSTAA